MTSTHARTHLEAVGADDAHIGRQSIAELDLDDVADDELLGAHVQLVAVADDDGELQAHNTRAL